MADAQQRTHSIDWAGAHRRIDEALRRIESDIVPAAAEKILRERAERYAPPVAAVDPGTTFDILAFSAGAKAYAVELGYCEAVAPLQDICPVPGLPAAYLGIVNHRGHIFPVLDLGALDGAPAGRAELKFCVLVRHEDAALAIAAGEIGGLRNAPAAEFARPDSGARAANDVVAGVTSGGAMLIDAARLLVDIRLQVNVEPEFVSQSVEAQQ